MVGKTDPHLNVKVGLNDTEAVRKLKRFSKTVFNTSTKIRSSLLLVTGALSTISAGFGQVAEAAIQYERALAEVQTISDRAAFSTERITKMNRELALTYGTGVTQGAKALYQTISAGVTDAGKAQQTLVAASKLSVGGLTDLTTSVDGLTSVLNAYKASNLSATEVADSFFVAIRDGKTTADQLSSSIGQVASIASQSGVKFDDLLASIATITTTGVATAEAVTQVRSALIAVTKQTPKAQAVAKKLGVDFSLAALQTKGLGRFLSELVNESGATKEELVQLFGRVEGYNAALAIASNNSEKFNQVLADMANKTGAADEATKRMSETFGFQVDKLKAVTDATTTAFGTIVTESDAARTSVGLLTGTMRGLLEVVDLIDRTMKRFDSTDTGPGFFERAAGRFGESFAERGGVGPAAAALAAFDVLTTSFFGNLDSSTKANLGRITLSNPVAQGEQDLAASIARGDGNNTVRDDFGPFRVAGQDSVLAPPGSPGAKRKGRTKGGGSSGSIDRNLSGAALAVLGEGQGKADAERQVFEDIARLREDQLKAEEEYNAKIGDLELARFRDSSENATKLNEAQRVAFEESKKIQEEQTASLKSFADQYIQIGANAIGGFVSNTVSDLITGSFEAKEAAGKFFGGILQQMGQGLIALGSSMVATGIGTSSVPAFAGLAGPAAIAGGLGIIAAGGTLAGVGAALGASGGSSRSSGSGARGRGSSVGTIDRISSRDTEPPVFGDDANPGGLGGAGALTVNVNFNTPTDSARAGRELDDVMRNYGRLKRRKF